MFKERRLSSRKKFDQEVMLESKSLGPITVYARNLSLRGMYVDFSEAPAWSNSEIPLTLGEFVMLSFYLPNDATHTRFRLNAAVIHLNNRGAGLRFDIMELTLFQRFNTAFISVVLTTVALTIPLQAMGLRDLNHTPRISSAIVATAPYFRKS